ncbi:MAG: glycosyltransferase [Bacteroidales bacterium]|nr:glycosyltransferase [Bacteroidales bacterium]
MDTNNSSTKYPKTLILGNPFNNKSGGGITMSNLFNGWPKDRLALATNANVYFEADFSICENYYQLGFNGKLHPFPLNIVLPGVYCGPINKPLSNNSDNQTPAQVPGRYKKIYRVIMYILDFMGVFNFLYRIKITPEFKKWLTEFNPDIIYSQLASRSSIRFVSDVADVLNKPVALHFMDDWITFINRPGLLYLYWKKKIDNEFKGLVERSSVLMSIGDAMSEEYNKRYKREFIPFHNPIDIGNWIPFSRTDWSNRERFTILYAGRIGLGMKDSIIDTARVVHNLSSENGNLIFEIQTPDIMELDGKVSFNGNVKWVKPTSYAELPKKFSTADLLILPIDFDDISIRFLKYSFQTKISEYMISGTPVLVYSPKETATAKYALKAGWAYVVTERNDLALANAILELKSNSELRKSLGQKAKQLAVSNEDAVLVREKFRETLSVNASNHYKS